MGKQSHLKETRRAERAGLPPMRTGLPKGVISNQTGDTFTIDSWGLDPPPLEYMADACDVDARSGAPTIYFAQMGPTRRAITAVAIYMHEGRFRQMVASFDEVRRILPSHVAKWTLPQLLEPPDLSGINSDSFRKFYVTFTRGACGEDIAMMDFYRLAPMVPQQRQYGVPKDLVQPSVRVFLSPPLLAYLLAQVDQKGLGPR